MNGQLTQGVESIVVDGSSDRIATTDLCNDYVELGFKIVDDDPRGMSNDQNLWLRHEVARCEWTRGWRCRPMSAV